MRQAPTRGDWVISDQIFDSTGHAVTRITCTRGQDCLAGYTHRVSCQPASRFWTFQWIELGLYGGLAIILVGLSFSWIRRRVT